MKLGEQVVKPVVTVFDIPEWHAVSCRCGQLFAVKPGAGQRAREQLFEMGHGPAFGCGVVRPDPTIRERRPAYDLLAVMVGASALLLAVILTILAAH